MNASRSSDRSSPFFALVFGLLVFAASTASAASPEIQDLTIGAGRSLSVALAHPASRVSVANPAVADAVVVSPQELLVNGLIPGRTSLVVWSREGGAVHYQLTVKMETDELSARLAETFPGEQIRVITSKETLILNGTASKPEIGDMALKIASDYSAKVVNNLSYPPGGRRQILVKMMFAEVNRQAVTELSASLTRIDPLNPRGDHEGMTSTGVPAPLGNFLNEPIGPDFSFGDAINLYAFSFRDKWSAMITALKTKGLVQVLAEPTLITADRQKASFLAGGEFPIPIAQAGAGFTSVTVEYKKFGISLDFLPEIRDDGTIVLQVDPEVSSLDFANSVVLSGFSIPALKVRRASTQVELKDGQSFAIAGLYSAELQQTKSKVPILGDIPLLGYLFKSKNLQKNKSELIVIATPTIVQPLPAGQLPALPRLDLPYDVDKKKVEAQEEPKSKNEGVAASEKDDLEKEKAKAEKDDSGESR